MFICTNFSFNNYSLYLIIQLSLSLPQYKTQFIAKSNKSLSFVLFRAPTHSWFYVIILVAKAKMAHCLFHLTFIILIVMSIQNL